MKSAGEALPGLRPPSPPRAGEAFFYTFSSTLTINTFPSVSMVSLPL